MTAQSVIARAMRLMNYLAAGQTPEAGEASDALVSLQAMVDAWRTKRLTMFTVTRTVYTWTANQASRTLGPSGSISGTRPEWIDRAGVIPVGGSLEIPLKMLNQDRYARIALKATTSTFPTDLLYEPTHPNGTLTVYPVPTTAPGIALYVPDEVANFTDLTTTYSAPAGYEDALVLQLARRMTPEWGAEWTTLLEDLAQEAFARIMSKNAGRQDEVKVDPGVMPYRPGHFNIYTGE